MATISAHWLQTSLAVWTLLQRRLLLKTTSHANAGVRATRPTLAPHSQRPLTCKRGGRVQQGPPVAPTPDAPSGANPWRVQHGPPVAPLMHKPGGGKDALWKWSQQPVSDPSDPRLVTCGWQVRVVAGTGTGQHRVTRGLPVLIPKGNWPMLLCCVAQCFPQGIGFKWFDVEWI